MKNTAKAAAALSAFLMLLTGCTADPNTADQSSSTPPQSSTPSIAPSSEESSLPEPEPVSEAPVSSPATKSSVPAAPAPTPAAPAVPVPTNIPESGIPFIARSYTDDELMQLDNTLNGYGQGVQKDAANRPVGAAAAQEKYAEYGSAFIAPPSNYVFLTFDLGYEYKELTSKILDTLAQKNAKGIFFVTMEYCRSRPKVVERIINEGHILGNHSVNHKSMPSLSVPEMREEIMGLHNYIKNTYGYEMFLFRPPMGQYSARTLAVAQSLGYQSMNWSFAYKDWLTAAQPDRAYALNKMLGDVHGGAIYLIHAVSETNAAVLGDVIDGIRAKGFEVARYTCQQP